ncbi:MAG: DUF3786 domain-containing protein [Anaerolineae bacterium]|nr:DUF3786 domain-containing protein [Anaerolineae bacterium]
MQEKGEPGHQAQELANRLAARVAETREKLRRIKPGKLALYSGCELDGEGNFRLIYFGREYLVSSTDFVVREATTGSPASPFVQSLLLTYLVTADGTTPSGRWVSFRELPDGTFYVRAFQGYSGDRLARELHGGIEAFRSAARALGGRPLSLGDASYAFTVLPRVSLALVYWAGDEELPSQAQVLFEDTASHYLPTDGLAILGSQLVARILSASAHAAIQ